MYEHCKVDLLWDSRKVFLWYIRVCVCVSVGAECICVGISVKVYMCAKISLVVNSRSYDVLLSDHAVIIKPFCCCYRWKVILQYAYI